MRNDLVVEAVHVADMRIDVRIRGETIAMDYPIKPGGGTTPLEGLLGSLAACAGNSLHAVLTRQMRAEVEALSVEARAERRKEHPTVLTAIELLYRLRGRSLDPALVARAVAAAEVLCPVLAMLRPGVQIATSFRLDARTIAEGEASEVAT
jgi:putative redox protein